MTGKEQTNEILEFHSLKMKHKPLEWSILHTRRFNLSIDSNRNAPQGTNNTDTIKRSSSVTQTKAAEAWPAPVI